MKPITDLIVKLCAMAKDVRHFGQSLLEFHLQFEIV